MKKFIQIVVIIILEKDNKYLLTLRHDIDPANAFLHNKWQLPGGGLEFAERPEETAVREAREELGIEVEIEGLVPHIYTEVRGEWHGVFITYNIKMKNPNAEIVINDEASRYGWFTLDEIKELHTLPGTLELLSKE